MKSKFIDVGLVLLLLRPNTFSIEPKRALFMAKTIKASTIGNYKVVLRFSAILCLLLCYLNKLELNRIKRC